MPFSLVGISLNSHVNRRRDMPRLTMTAALAKSWQLFYKSSLPTRMDHVVQVTNPSVDPFSPHIMQTSPRECACYRQQSFLTHSKMPPGLRSVYRFSHAS